MKKSCKANHYSSGFASHQTIVSHSSHSARRDMSHEGCGQMIMNQQHNNEFSLYLLFGKQQARLNIRDSAHFIYNESLITIYFKSPNSFIICVVYASVVVMSCNCLIGRININVDIHSLIIFHR